MFLFVLNILFLSRCCCVHANHVIMFLKKFWTKRSSNLRYFTYFVDFWNLIKLHKDMLLWILCVRHWFMARKVHILIMFMQNYYKLIAILRRQFCIILTASWKKIYSVLGGVAKRPSPIWRIYVSFKRRDLETAILHYIDGVYYSAHNMEYTFSQLVVNIMQNCRLKIAISL